MVPLKVRETLGVGSIPIRSTSILCHIDIWVIFDNINIFSDEEETEKVLFPKQLIRLRRIFCNLTKLSLLESRHF